MRRPLLYSVAILGLSYGSALACGGGGSAMRLTASQIFSVKNAYEVANHLFGAGKSVSGHALGAVNSMMFDMVSFFSEEENVEDFARGLQHFQNTGPGEMGKPSGMTSEEFSALTDL